MDLNRVWGVRFPSQGFNGSVDCSRWLESIGFDGHEDGSTDV